MSAYGPPYADAALRAAWEASTSETMTTPEVRAMLAAAHDPALRVRDRSFNGGAILDWLRDSLGQGAADAFEDALTLGPDDV